MSGQLSCPRCGFKENDHEGLYCSQCGRSFVEMKCRSVLFVETGEVELELAVRNPFEGETLKVTEVRLGERILSADSKIGPGEGYVSMTIEMNSGPVTRYETHHLAVEIDRLSNAYVLHVGAVRFSPLPVVDVGFAGESTRQETVVKLSPSKDYTEEVLVYLENDAILNIGGIRFTAQAHGPLERPLWFDAMVVGDGYRQLVERGDNHLLCDFGGANVGQIGDREQMYRATHLLGEDGLPIPNIKPMSADFAFGILELPRIELGIRASTSHGFVFVVHNRAREKEPEDVSSVFSVDGVPGYIDDQKLDSDNVSCPVIRQRLDQLADRRIELMVPKGIKRRRDFALFLNYKKSDDREIDTINNYCRIRLTRTLAGEPDGLFLSNAISYWEMGSQECAHLNDELELTGVNKLHGFQIDFNFPREVEMNQVRLDLEITRFNPLNKEQLSTEFTCELIINLYEPMENVQPISIDFGTTNTCVVGPDIVDGEVTDNHRCYELAHYHQLSSENARILPTAVAYRLAGGNGLLPFIPNLLDSSDQRSRSGFKRDLFDEFTRAKISGEKPALDVTADFFQCLIVRLQLYYEDRGCNTTILGYLRAAAPVCFPPELRHRIAKAAQRTILAAYGSYYESDDTSKQIFRIETDEPFAVLVHALQEGEVKPRMDSERDDLVGVLDFGGGTLDVAFTHIAQGENPKLVATGGSTQIGGDTIDEWVAYRLLEPANSEASLTARNVKISKVSNQLRNTLLRTHRDNHIFRHRFATIKERFYTLPRRHFENDLDPAYLEKYEECVVEWLCSQTPDVKVGDGLTKYINERIIGAYPDYFAAQKKSELSNWSSTANITEHLLMPLYSSLFETLKSVMKDSLDEALKNLHFSATDKKLNLLLLMAGNVSRLPALARVLLDVLDVLRREYPSYEPIYSVDVKSVKEPKLSVVLGTHTLSTGVPINIDRKDDPPFDVYCRSHQGVLSGERSHIERYGDHDGIPIFRKGAKYDLYGKRRSRIPRVLGKEDLAGKERLPRSIHLTRKIGLDTIVRPCTVEQLHVEADKVLFVLGEMDEIKAFSFSESEDLEESDYLREAIEKDKWFAKELSVLIERS